MSIAPSGLGRGLGALIPTDERSGPQLVDVPLSAVVPNPRQPRGVFDADELEGLATSIKDVGLLQPIVVRPLGSGRYELVAGERRLRASRLAGLARIPAVVRETRDADRLKEALVENIHRVPLNPLEEAAAYRQLLDDFDFTQDQLAQRLGKSRSTITNAMRLLQLDPAVQRRVAAGELSAGHARALLGLEDADGRAHLAEQVVQDGLSVRATEERVRLANLGSSSRRATSRSAGEALAGVRPLEERLSEVLEAPVRITMGARRGKIQVTFGSVGDLERIVGVIAAGVQTSENVR